MNIKILNKAIIYAFIICLGVNLFIEIASRMYGSMKGPWESILYAMQHKFEIETTAKVESIFKYESRGGKGRRDITYVVTYSWKNRALECRSAFVSARIAKVPYSMVSELYKGGPIKAYVTQKGCHAVLIKEDAVLVLKKYVFLWFFIFVVLILFSYWCIDDS